MSSKNWFGPRDSVVSLTPPEGFEAVHQEGMTWYKDGINEFETTKKFAYEFNSEIAQLRGLLTVSGIDLSDLPENSPFLLREVILRAIMRILSMQEIDGYGLLDKATYDPDDDGIVAVAQGGTGAATPAAARAALGAVSSSDVAALVAGPLADKAPLASPALTGNPTAPTQTAGNNSTRLATTAFVQAAIAALVNSSPAALDTLNELATALGNDPNFATTMTTALASKAPLASPALTGNPTAPTQTAGDNSTRLATTAFVQAAVAASGSLLGTTLTDVSGSRAVNTSYQNTSGRWRIVYVGGTGNGLTVQVSANNSTWLTVLGESQVFKSMILVPPGWYYRATVINGTAQWLES